MPEILHWPVRPYRGLRGIDDFGSGAWKAPRGSRKHRGLDFAAFRGDGVVGPFAGEITRIGIAYPGSTLGSIHIRGARAWKKYKFRVLYCRLLPKFKVGDLILSGELFATAQRVADRYVTKDSWMINHIHLDMWKRTLGVWRRIDPTPHFEIAHVKH